MNIWLLHPFAGGPGLGRHWRPFWLADAWQRMGHRALIISAAFHHLHMKPRSPGLQHIGGKHAVDWRIRETGGGGNGPACLALAEPRPQRVTSPCTIATASLTSG